MSKDKTVLSFLVILSFWLSCISAGCDPSSNDPQSKGCFIVYQRHHHHTDLFGSLKSMLMHHSCCGHGISDKYNNFTLLLADRMQGIIQSEFEYDGSRYQQYIAFYEDTFSICSELENGYIDPCMNYCLANNMVRGFLDDTVFDHMKVHEICKVPYGGECDLDDEGDGSSSHHVTFKYCDRLNPRSQCQKIKQC
eukprot:TRINITY_DN3264_c0_g1_i1.p2 TRINITY_DN3264_c0_g1~~TRINITY_DN3264_c0_g1_i1.p2  ORF type:complete len:194 (-),score=25.19 TRINITY_DN3264_c0_g1_i1:677-1258(-)